VISRLRVNVRFRKLAGQVSGETFFLRHSAATGQFHQGRHNASATAQMARSLAADAARSQKVHL